ncbi:MULTISPECIES: glycosyltransferase family 2 protein [unclassified Marinimicrobium]|jgi:glycosyltransferase involved in cell wall biosynthesis|uniref:glycosyltransferase family 2 protein n=1 Tax=unclassified Marinimicrobium TaxID=2632100 RepID=UPI000C447F02|nr:MULTISPECIES: glycosyltransferase [unclassified Marinimicrobium]MAN51397.1 hypothetical protein [Marinimicrobium sp.]|tara:strand:- start:13365 stop:14312 length:948 start_codon:yes stop_codon:yes gene_type:complete
MPKATVIIPAYNAENYIEESINSILSQSFQDFEIVVVNDGSTDRTSNVVRSIDDSRIQLIEQSNSGGPSKPRNVGIAASNGEYIFMFDSDDLMHREKIELSISALNSVPSGDLLFTNFRSIDEKGEVLKGNFLKDGYDSFWSLINSRSNVSLIENAEIFPSLIRANFIGTSSVVIRRSALGPEDRFNERLRNSDDRLFWIHFARHHNFIFLNEILHSYRIQPNSISNQGFIRRADSKIEALKIVSTYCKGMPTLNRIARRQIGSDYVSLSFALRESRKEYASFKMALKAIPYNLELRTFKNILSSIRAIIRRLLF